MQEWYRHQIIPDGDPSQALLLPPLPDSSRNVDFVKARKAPESFKSLIPEEICEHINENDPAIVKHWWGLCSLTSIKALEIPPCFLLFTLDHGPLSYLLLQGAWKRHKSCRNFCGGAPEPNKK